MNFKFPAWRSLNTQVTLFTLVIFLASIWTLAFFAVRMLHEDMQREMGEQQMSTVTLIAQELDNDLTERLDALKAVAAKVTPAMMADTPALQQFLQDREVFQSLFNAGTFFTGPDGIATASIPLLAKRAGTNYMYRDHVAAALRQGRTGIGNPIVGKALQVPVISMVVPVFNPQGQVMGTLIGVVDLSKPSFLDRISENRYGKTGSYVVVDRRARQIVAATEKSRILEVLPAPGIIPVIDQAMQGDVNAAVFVNPQGVEMLGSSRGVPVANWHVAVILPTREAFAPIEALQLRMVLLTLLVSLLAAALTWWMMRRQLAPLLATVKTLASVSATNRPPQPLPVTTRDEIGELIGSFNALLATLGQREEALRQSEESLAITLHSIADGVIATDAQGRITRMNAAAERLTGWPLSEAMGRDLPVVFNAINAFSTDLSIHPVQPVADRDQTLGLASHTALLARDGEVYQITDSTAPILDASGHMVGVVLVFSDVTGQHRVQESLKASEDLYRTVVNWSPNPILMHRDGLLLYLNPAAVAMFAADSETDLVGTPVLDRVHPDFKEIARARIKAGMETGHAAPVIEQRLLKVDGTVMDAEVQGIPVVFEGKPTVLTAVHDITERKQIHNALQASLKEKVALLNEVHHRVKNNLQVIASLLRLEAGRSTQQDTRTVLTDMQGRIHSMALLHESLYRAGTFAAVDLGVYLRELATQAFRAMASGTGAVRLQLELDTVHVSMDQATPCGLLVNELISNCFKHGFVNGQGGEIKISLQALPSTPEGASPVRLCVSDNGVGLGDDFEAKRGKSLGLQLVDDLSRQLAGHLEVGPGPGAVFVVCFNVDKSKIPQENA